MICLISCLVSLGPQRQRMTVHVLMQRSQKLARQLIKQKINAQWSVTVFSSKAVQHSVIKS